VVSVLLGFMAISGLIGKSNLEGFTLRIEPPAEVYDGVDTLLRVHLVCRRRWLPLFLLRVELLDAGTTFIVVGREEEGSGTLPVVLHGRGRQCLETVRVTSRFPVNFFIRSRLLRLDRDVIVFPAPHPCPGSYAAVGGRRDGVSNTARRGEQGEVARIADYTGSEPLKRVHWKLSARNEGLKVKEFSDSSDEPVVLDPEELPGDFEGRLRCASYLVNRYHRAGRAVGLRLPLRLIPPATGELHKLRLLRELALYGQD